MTFKRLNQHEPAGDEEKYSISRGYKLRKAQELEAQEEIDEYCTNERNPDRLDGLGSKRRERGKGEL